MLFVCGGFQCFFCTGGEKAHVATNLGESFFSARMKSEPWHRLFRWLLAKGCRTSCFRQACQLPCLLWSVWCPLKLCLVEKSLQCLWLRGASLRGALFLFRPCFSELLWKQKAPLRNVGAARKIPGFPEALLPSFSPSCSLKTGEISSRIEQRLLSLFPDQKTELSWCLILGCAGLYAV